MKLSDDERLERAVAAWAGLGAYAKVLGKKSPKKNRVWGIFFFWF